MTAKQEKLIENYVRTKVRSMLKEKKSLNEVSSKAFAVFRKDEQGSKQLMIYNTQGLAEKVARFLDNCIDDDEGEYFTQGDAQYFVKPVSVEYDA